MMNRRLWKFSAAFLLCGCVSPWALTARDYERVALQVNLGDSKAEVIEILGPTQHRLRSHEKKPPDRYIKNGVNVEILYFRSGWQSDGLTTDDEFTPYLFNDNVLVGVGWQALGGIGTQGQAPDGQP
jgi:hypothetical protein